MVAVMMSVEDVVKLPTPDRAGQGRAANGGQGHVCVWGGGGRGLFKVENHMTT